jgi:hypothetical protein
MSDKIVESNVGMRRRTRGGTAVVLLLLAMGLAGMPYVTRPASAEILDPNVIAFGASPTYINLAMTTTVTVEIGSSYGAGLDNYLATVSAPGGGTATAWFNFTAIGSMSVIYGDATLGFLASVGLVGTYGLRLEYFNGIAFSLAAIAQFSATDQLLVVTEAATASNEYTDVHNCPIAQEFQRGGEVIARAYVRYASTGEFVNGTSVPSARGNITGTLFGVTKALTWQNVYKFWRAAFFPAWNQTTGVIVFTADASDGRGNRGTGSSFPTGLTAWKITPAVLKVVPRVLNESGAPDVVFEPGDTVRIEARVTYESHNAHNRAFPGPLNATRGGQVSAVLGYGPFNATSGQFETTVATLTLAHDATTENWSANYVVKDTDPLRADLQVYISASDGAGSPPNTGKAFTTMLAFRAAPPSPPPPTPAGFDLMVVIAVSLLLLIVGVGAGAFLGRRGRGGTPSKAEAKKEIEEEWEVKEEELK